MCFSAVIEDRQLKVLVKIPIIPAPTLYIVLSVYLSVRSGQSWLKRPKLIVWEMWFSQLLFEIDTETAAIFSQDSLYLYGSALYGQSVCMLCLKRQKPYYSSKSHQFSWQLFLFLHVSYPLSLSVGNKMSLEVT